MKLCQVNTRCSGGEYAEYHFNLDEFYTCRAKALTRAFEIATKYKKDYEGYKDLGYTTYMNSMMKKDGELFYTEYGKYVLGNAFETITVTVKEVELDTESDGPCLTTSFETHNNYLGDRFD